MPSDWKLPILLQSLRKVTNIKPATIGPVSLACILGKCMEHIIVSSISTHLDTNTILNPLQHGFRKRLSRHSQLLLLFHDLASVPTETDMIVMDFSKAFDKVPHRILLYKLEWYGIRGGTHDWIKFFLTDRTQRVVLDGTESLPGPQGSVLGSILFLIYIKDLPDGVAHSTVCPFADDCILYRHVTEKNDINRLQMDLWTELPSGRRPG